jgi:hypothetical protein
VPVEKAPSDNHRVASQTKQLFDHTETLRNWHANTVCATTVSHISRVEKGSDKYMYRTVVLVARSQDTTLERFEARWSLMPRFSQNWNYHGVPLYPSHFIRESLVEISIETYLLQLSRIHTLCYTEYYVFERYEPCAGNSVGTGYNNYSIAYLGWYLWRILVAVFTIFTSIVSVTVTLNHVLVHRRVVTIVVPPLVCLFRIAYTACQVLVVQNRCTIIVGTTIYYYQSIGQVQLYVVHCK